MNCNNNIVICDRYLFDFVVDQAKNMGQRSSGMEYIFQLPIIRLFPVPDVLFILDVKPEIGQKRKQDGTSVEYLEERWELYHYLKDLPYATIIDANSPFEVVTRQVTEYTMNYLKQQGVINA